MESATHLRFLLSLGNTKMVVLTKEDNLHIYSNQPGSSTRKGKVAASRVCEAILAD